MFEMPSMQPAAAQPAPAYGRTKRVPQWLFLSKLFNNVILADRAAFSRELTDAITKLVSKYHDESAPGGRAHRLVIVAHPVSQQTQRASRANEPRERSGDQRAPRERA